MVNARFDVYHFDDTDPTEDPESTLVRSVEIPMPVTASGEWERIELALPPGTFEGDPAPNMVLLYVSVDPPRATGETTLDIDDMAFVEWRDASKMPAWSGVYDRVRNSGTGAVSLSFSGFPARR